MQITEVRKSCHCLDFIPMTKVLQPNETGEFVITMNTGKFVGFNAQTFYVTFGPKFVSTAVTITKECCRPTLEMIQAHRLPLPRVLEFHREFRILVFDRVLAWITAIHANQAIEHQL